MILIIALTLISLIEATLFEQVIHGAVELLQHHGSRCVNVIHIEGEKCAFSINFDEEVPVVTMDLAQVPVYGSSPSKAFCPDNIIEMANLTDGGGDDFVTRFALSDMRYVIVGRSSLTESVVFRRMARAVFMTVVGEEVRVQKYVTDPAGDNHLEVIGKIQSGGTGLSFLGHEKDLFSPQTDFGGRELRAVAFQFYPYSQPDFENNLSHGGFEYRIAEAVVSSLNFKMTIRKPSSGARWGREDSPGSNRYDGMIGDLQRGIGDIGWGNLWVTEARIKAMDFTDFYALESACFLVPQADPYRGPRVLVFPLEKKTWIGLLISLAAVAGFYLIHSLMWPDIGYGFAGMAMDGAMSVVNQSSHKTSKFYTDGLRLANGIFFLSLLVLTLWYSGALISFLSVSVRPTPPDNFQELSKEVAENNWSMALCCTHIILALKESSLDSFKLFYSKVFCMFIN